MRIAYISTMKSGLTLFNYREIEALTRKGHEVQLFVLRNEAGLYNPLPEWDVNPISWPHCIINLTSYSIRRPLAFARLLGRAIRTRTLIDLTVAMGFVDKMRDMDVAYVSWGDHKLFTGYYCKLITNIPLIVCIHAYELYNNPNPKFFPEALAYCDRVTTVCDYNKNFLIQNFGTPASQIDVVHHGIDLDIYKLKPKIKILIVGFFTEKKGHDVLFSALKLLNRSDVELWVVGDETPDVIPVNYRLLARELGVDSKVVFFGVQHGNALRALYRECDVFCLPSRIALNGDQEGLPTVVAEAMAFSKPIVATRHAGIPEAIDAVLVGENKVEQLADALSKICNSIELRHQLGARNRTKAEQMFSPANHDKLEQILLKNSRNYSNIDLPNGQVLGN